MVPAEVPQQMWWWEISLILRVDWRKLETLLSLGWLQGITKMPPYLMETMTVECPLPWSKDFTWGPSNIIEQMVDAWMKELPREHCDIEKQYVTFGTFCFTYYVMSDVCWYFFPSKKLPLKHWSQYWGGAVPAYSAVWWQNSQASGWLAHRSSTPLNSNTESSVLQEIPGTRALFFAASKHIWRGIKPSSTSLCYSEPTTNYIPIITAPHPWIKRKFQTHGLDSKKQKPPSHMHPLSHNAAASPGSS